ncbi:hypothetical protein POM88_034338 [Heracleum sosnowskyi]|uniref:Rho-GAP domain-containing protein n=1 Tax=Heracleum sosnowskyi TaxID=360622 RepID=A0AAD8HKD7_9APIA|nr:hypothetical protein POM88_034338 [Heracleum sosnowskyi]
MALIKKLHKVIYCSFKDGRDSMQLSYDHRGNSVPTILLLMQQQGIFRINAENSQEEFVRNQLNTGVVPAGIDLHCLAGLIKAWFRELPEGCYLQQKKVLQNGGANKRIVLRQSVNVVFIGIGFDIKERLVNLGSFIVILIVAKMKWFAGADTSVLKLQYEKKVLDLEQEKKTLKRSSK